MLDKAKAHTILVIDHNSVVNQTLQLLLEDAGYRAIAAPNLDAAVHLLSSVKVDLVVCNYMEPAYRRGKRWPILEMFKYLAAPGTPFVVLTTVPEDLEQSVQELGVDHIVGKPFAVDNLVDRVARSLASLDD